MTKVEGSASADLTSPAPMPLEHPVMRMVLEDAILTVGKDDIERRDRSLPSRSIVMLVDQTAPSST